VLVKFFEEILMMHRIRLLPILILLILGLAGCQEQAPEPGVDMTALRQALLKKTEELYQIHLKLDTAAANITAAEVKARSADCSDAEYLAADAYRILEQADQDLLQLGRDLQVLFNLDVEVTNSP
jgi:hypothetical protein